MKGTYRATKWNIFKHRMGIQHRMCFMYTRPAYNNWLSKMLWKFWYPPNKF